MQDNFEKRHHPKLQHPSIVKCIMEKSSSCIIRYKCRISGTSQGMSGVRQRQYVRKRNNGSEKQTDKHKRCFSRTLRPNNRNYHIILMKSNFCLPGWFTTQGFCIRTTINLSIYLSNKIKEELFLPVIQDFFFSLSLHGGKTIENPSAIKLQKLSELILLYLIIK